MPMQASVSASPADGVVDLTRAIEGATWATVAIAAEAAAVDEATVRSWCDTGRVPSQQSGVDEVLVPIEAVQALATGDAEVADGFRSEVIDLNAQYWSSEAEAAREELADAMRRIALLQQELLELRASERAARLLVADLEADNAVLRASIENQAPTVLHHAADDYLPDRERGRRRHRR
jgi:hypothetical protein